MPRTVLSSWFQKDYPFKNLPADCTIIVDIPGQFGAEPNIFIQVEPEIICQQEAYLIANHHRYYKIYTYNEKVLAACKNAVKYYYGTKWLEPHLYLQNDIRRKKFQISNLAGNKNIRNAPGHIIRQVIHHTQDRIQAAVKIPMTFFRSSRQGTLIKDYGSNPIIGDHKDALFAEYQYAFIIENHRSTNYFTEKLVDCLLMRTIPVYYGAPNIAENFNTAGWVILENGSLKEIAEKLGAIDPDHYARHAAVIEENYHKALSYSDLYANIDNGRKK